MANTVEELDFRLIIDDSEFNKKIKDVESAARQLNQNLSDILDIKNKVTNVGKDEVTRAKQHNQILKDNAKTQGVIARETEKTAQANRKLRANTDSNIAKTEAVDKEKVAQATIKTAAAQERLNQLIRRGEQPLRRQSQLWMQLKNLSTAYFSVMGVSRLVSALVRTTSEFELQRTTLGAILQDIEKANVLYGQMKELAVKSPFNFKELVTYAKQLTAFSIPAKELYDTTKMLADVSAGLGVSMDRLVLAYGQIRSASFLRGQEVRQLTEAGIPILEELRKQFVELGEEGITVGDVFDKISKRLVPFEMVSKVFKDMTSEGGKFYQMQEIQAETLRGKLSNLKDAYQIMLSEIGEKQDGVLKGSVNALRALADNYETVGRLILTLVSTYGAYKAALVMIRIWQSAEVLAMTKGIGAYKKLGKAISIATLEGKGFAAVSKIISKINPIAAIGAAAAGLAIHFIQLGVEARKFRKELEQMANTKFTEADKSVETFQRLADQLKNSTEGSQSYRDAIAQLNRQYGDYLPNLLNEKNALQEILKVENEVTNAIYARAKAYASEEGLKKIEERYGTKATETQESLIGTLKWANVGEDAARDFMRGFKLAVIDNDSEDVLDLFEKKFNEYFGENKSASMLPWVENYNMLSSAIKNYAKAVKSYSDEEERFLKEIDTRFGAQGYSSDLERRIIEPINAAFHKAKQELDGATKSVEEYNDALNGLKLNRLYQIKSAYEQLDAVSGSPGSYLNKIKEIQEQINALQPKDLGWLQKLVNPLVTGKGNNDLKAQIEDGYDEYVDKLRKEYKAVTEAYADSDKTYNKLTADKEKGLLTDEKILQKATEQNELYKQRKKVIEDISKALGISLETSTRKGGGAKSQEQKDLETKIDLLKKLQSAYEKLSEYASDDEMPDLLSKFFSSSKVGDKGDIIQQLNFRKQLIDAALELEKYDKDAAEKLRTSIGYDEVSEQVNAYKELAKARKDAIAKADEYYRLMREWSGEDFNLSGDGVIFDISKIVSALNTEIDEIERKGEKVRALLSAAQKGDEVALAEVRKKYGDEFWNYYVQKGSEAIDELVGKEREAARKTAQEKINDLAQKYVKETLFNANIDLTNLSDRNILQLLKLKDRLQAAMDENPVIITADVSRILDANGVGKLSNGEYDLSNIDINSLKDGESEISEATKNLLSMLKTVQAAKLSFNSLGESISKVFKGKFSDLADEEKKEILSLASSAMKAASEIGGLLGKIGDVTGNSGLSGAGEALQGLASVGSSIAQGFASGGVWGAAIAGGVELIKQFANGLLEAAEYAKAARTAMDDFVQSVKMAELDNLISGENGIFGTDSIGNLQKDRTALKKALDAILEQEKNFMKNEDLLYGDSKDVKWWQKIDSVLLPGVYQTLNGWTKIATGQWDWTDILSVMDAGAMSQILDPTGLEEFTYGMLTASNAIDTFSAAFKNMQIKTKDYNGFLEFFGARDEYMSLGDFFPDLFNKDGSINYDLLDEALDAIEKNGVELTSEQKKMLDTMRANYEKYKDALQSIRDYLSDIFGELANTIADQMIDAFARTGNAAIDMGDTFADVTRKMAKDMIVSILYTRVFDSLQDKIEKIYTDIDDPAKRTEAALTALREGLSDISALAPELTDLLRGIEETFGVSFAEGADSLANGIKGITEDTANLLASYLNAIRADVSYGKVQRDNILTEIKNLAISFNVPTLNDYLNQIQANTYNSALRTEQILSRIDSMMGLGDEGSALRVITT